MTYRHDRKDGEVNEFGERNVRPVIDGKRVKTKEKAPVKIR